jgi:molecular chaperone GrpE
MSEENFEEPMVEEDADESAESVSKPEAEDAQPESDGSDNQDPMAFIENELLSEEGVTRQLAELVKERTADLQRLQAEYVNYKRRVDRDRMVSRQQGEESVVRDLLPVLDAITQAEQHQELDGGFRAVASELNKLAEKHGLTSFGELGEEFDPNLHEALMQQPTNEVPPMSIAQVMQLGYRLGDTVLRPARVAVAVAADEDD